MVSAALCVCGGPGVDFLGVAPSTACLISAALCACGGPGVDFLGVTGAVTALVADVQSFDDLDFLGIPFLQHS